MKPTKGLSCDGACAGNPGRGEFRVVDIATGETVYQSRIYDDATNNMMEALAVVTALAFLRMDKRDDVVYTDSQTARTWVKNKKFNSGYSTSNQELKDVIARAEMWLRNNEHNKVEAWLTREWGESQSDFQRKGVR